jgi:hypothetical protein
MTAPRFNILTQKEITIDLSRPAMEVILYALSQADQQDYLLAQDSVSCEVDNFISTLHNLMERSEPEPGNLDLIGE